MKKAFAATALLVFAAWAQGAAAEEAVVYASASAVRMLAPLQAKAGVALSASNHGTGQLILDVIDGKAQAAVVPGPLPQALDAARETAWSKGRILGIPESLVFHEVAALRSGDVPVGFVTVGEPTGALASVIADLR